MSEAGFPSHPDPFLVPGLVDDPHPTYHRCRETGPVVALRGGDRTFLVTGYAEVEQLLRSDRVSADRARSPSLRRMLEQAPPHARPGSERRSMLVRDDPSHARLRGAVNQAFHRRSVETLEPRIRVLAETLLDGRADTERFDLVGEFAEPLAALVIAELVGIDPADQERFRAWTRQLLAPLVGDGEGSLDDGGAGPARRQLDRYWLELLRERRAAPRDDLASELVRPGDDAPALSEPELLAMLNLLLVAGHETSANLIGTTLWHLLRDPDRRREARSLGDEAWGNLVEEMLRWQSPIQAVARVTTDEIEVAGGRLPAGATLTLLLAAANRDPAVFEAPDHFDRERANARRHLAFGFGDHFCLGAALARAEVGIAVRSALAALGEATLAETAPLWRRTPLLRGLERLIVEPGGR